MGDERVPDTTETEQVLGPLPSGDVEEPDRFPGGPDSLADEEKYGDIPTGPLAREVPSEANPATSVAPEGGHQEETDVRDTQPGNRDTGDHPGMGVSSERVGVAGPGQLGTEGVRDTSDEEPAEAGTDTETVDPVEAPDGETVVREQRRGLPETNPDPVEPHPHHEKHNPGHTHG